MFDIAWSEFLLIAVVALVVVGPRDLPALLRTVGKALGSMRRMAGEFQSQFNEAMREAELDELRKDVGGLKDAASKLMSGPDPFKIARDEIRGAIDKPAPSALAGAAPALAAQSTDGQAEPVPSAFAPAPPEELPAPAEADFAARDPKKINGAAHPSAPPEQEQPVAQKGPGA